MLAGNKFPSSEGVGVGSSAKLKLVPLGCVPTLSDYFPNGVVANGEAGSPAALYR